MIDFLYGNIGAKIKRFVMISFFLEAIGAIIAGFILIVIGLLDGEEGYLLYGFLTMFLGPIAALIASWPMYAFGELVEKTTKNEENTADILDFLEKKEISDMQAEPRSINPMNNNFYQQNSSNTGSGINRDNNMYVKSFVEENLIEYWTCSCGCRNNINSRRCSNCYSDYKPDPYNLNNRNENLKTINPVDIQTNKINNELEINTIQKAPIGEWTCSCGCRNSANARRCSNCYRDYNLNKYESDNFGSFN